MGEYNRRAPYVLGEEWVPIRNESTAFSPAVDIVELGHSFTTVQTYTLGDARFYLNELPPGRALGQIFLASIYRKGEEANTGPVQSVQIPVNSVVLSGVSVVNASTGHEAVADPSDNKYLSFTTGDTAGFHFALDDYSAQLSGKRIVNARIWYVAAMSSSTSGTVPASGSRGLLALSGTLSSNQYAGYGEPELQPSLVGAHLSYIDLGEIDYLWSLSSPNATTERLPWTYAGLQQLESTASAPIRFLFDMDANTSNTLLSYVMLEVFYCEESRLAYGGKAFGQQAFTTSTEPYIQGANIIDLRDTDRVSSPSLLAGDYSLVVSSANIGDAGGPFGLELRKVSLSQYPSINALRELYAIPAHPGVQVNATQKIGQTFTVEQPHVLPQLSLHTSVGTPIPSVHSYGRLAHAPVYGSVTATQDIYDNSVGGSADFPQVRFYARRFGNTVIPLMLDSPNITGDGLSVSITPTELDELPELIDGWREVTLRFPTAPTMGTLSEPQWRWSATGENINNRWEVLAVSAPALSGLPGDLQNQVPSGERLGTTTYGSLTAGDTVALTWNSPNITGMTEDPDTDAVLLFSQDPNAITGISVSQETQALTAFSECGSGPCCIPTELQYNKVTWSPSHTPEPVIFDKFTRSSSSAWGTPTVGPYDYTDSGGAASDYNVNGSQGTHTLTSTVVSRKSVVGTIDGCTLTLDITVPVVATGAAIESGVIFRWQDSSNYLRAVLMFGTDERVELNLTSRVSGIETVLSSTVVGSYGAGDTWRVVAHLTNVGNSSLNAIYMKAWRPGVDVEPDDWQTYTHTVNLLLDGAVGVYSMLLAGNTNGTIDLTYDNFSAQSNVLSGYELQRFDDITSAWHTIMKSSSTALNSFNDFEARVGEVSSYRIRSFNVLNFNGPWSDAVTGTVPEPGVTLPSCGSAKRGILMFTSNADQSGAYNMAYAMTWEGDVAETFFFPETDDVSAVKLHDRDYMVVTHGTERGGEQFTRTLLLSNAAVSNPRLANMRNLRDMAWADLPYVCVRDDLGDRWLASVVVPVGNVRRNRRLYNAEITVLETTDTPSPVDPS